MQYLQKIKITCLQQIIRVDRVIHSKSLGLLCKSLNYLNVLNLDSFMKAEVTEINLPKSINISNILSVFITRLCYVKNNITSQVMAVLHSRSYMVDREVDEEMTKSP